MIQPKVSVCMITYNHENYIREAIEGVLMQQCDFEVELILANDCSTDKTDEVIQDILTNHPRASWIKYKNHTENKGMMPNFIWALEQCKGTYIALCEGDDYWTDPLKLQKQVDFLEGNQEYVLHFHNAEVIKNVKNKKNERRRFYNVYNKTEYTANDVLASWIIPTASIVFRNVITKYPKFFKEAVFGDLALQVYLCEYGKMYALDEVMSIYRINDDSITIKSINNLKHSNKLIKQLELMNSFFDEKYNSEIMKKIFLLNLEKANYFKNKSILKQSYLFLKTISLNPLLAYRFNKKVVNAFKSIVVTLLTMLNIKKSGIEKI